MKNGDVSFLNSKEITYRKTSLILNNKIYKSGDSFGQESLIHNTNRELSAFAIKDCYLAFLNKKAFLEILCNEEKN